LLTVIAIITFGINSSYAQSSDNFKNYTNNDLNFTIDYPSDWKVNANRSSEGIIQFRIANGESPVLVVAVENATRFLNTDTMTIDYSTPEQYATEELDNLTNRPSLNFKPIQSNESNVAGNSGWKMEYSIDTTGLHDIVPKNLQKFTGPSYNFELYTVKNGKIYELDYEEHPLRVPLTLPLVNKMVESFRIIK
jgi:photosystem II reaction center protein PsbP